MPTPNPKITPTDRDSNDLRTLSVCWYVYAATLALGALSMLAMTLIVALMMAYMSSASRDPAPTFSICPIVFLAIPTTIMGILTVNAFAIARYLPARVAYGTCFFSSIVHAVLFVPLGTILGIFTIMVIRRDSIRPTFREDDE